MRGVVAAGHPDTAAAGLEILEAGGTAADAVVAAAFAAMVAEASLTGLGAGGFALVRPPAGAPRLLDFFVTAPGKGRSPEELRERSHLVQYYVPFRATTQLFNVGPSSCAVPGIVPGLTELHSQFGRLAFERVLEPAARLARNGARLTPPQDYLHDILAGILTETDEMRAVFAPEGRLLRAGELLRMPDLASSLQILADEGPETFRSGTLARRMADSLEAAGGLLTLRDLEEYEVIERKPVELRYRDLEIWSNPLPSSGGTLIAFTLLLLDRQDLSGGDASGRALALAEALRATTDARREGFDRNLYDPDFARDFLSAAHVRKHLPGRGNTTHLSVIDENGLAVSLTSSCGSGSGVVVPGTGIIMNNMMGEEDLNPGGYFALAPGTRLTSMMAPTIALGRGRLLALGSAGSERLRSAIVQILVNIIDLGLDLQTAVNRPRMHVDGRTVHLEPGFPESVVEILTRNGYEPHVWPEQDLFFGGVQIAGAKVAGTGSPVPDAGRPTGTGWTSFSGGGDPRRGGVALTRT
ncbi:MAG: gamma-glutamyltransferase [Thermoleophilia bacterium]